jgi:hypothetical protein
MLELKLGTQVPLVTAHQSYEYLPNSKRRWAKKLPDKPIIIIFHPSPSFYFTNTLPLLGTERIFI